MKIYRFSQIVDTSTLVDILIEHETIIVIFDCYEFRKSLVEKIDIGGQSKIVILRLTNAAERVTELGKILHKATGGQYMGQTFPNEAFMELAKSIFNIDPTK